MNGIVTFVGFKLGKKNRLAKIQMKWAEKIWEKDVFVAHKWLIKPSSDVK